MNNLQQRVENWKKSLLDMTKRNRLLWYKKYRVGSLELTSDIFDSASSNKSAFVLEDDNIDPVEVVKQLLNDIPMKFSVDLPVLPEKPDEDDKDSMAKYKEIEKQREKIKARTKALENIRMKIKSENDEKGLNIGYIAVGFLKWYEREDAVDEIRSPLIMIPVKVEQDSRKEPFIISLNPNEEVAINPVIQKKFLSDFKLRIQLAENDEQGNNFDLIDDTLKNIEHVIKNDESWSVENNIIVDTFDFQNLVIWNDFDKNGDLIENSPFGKLLGGEEAVDVGLTYEEGDPDLEEIKSERNICILESDSSQLEAIYRARNGESFVIQGPPGTGKSQTITNIIAEQLYLGKKVLFVSEKQAALDVVYHKLSLKGLGDFCLIMHNSRQKKSDVRQQLEKSLLLAQNRQQVAQDALETFSRVDNSRSKLNLYTDKLHEEYTNGTNPYFIIGELAKLKEVIDLNFDFPDDFDLNSDYTTTINEIFTNIDNYAKSFIDDTRHFDDNLWKEYTGEFSNTTRREVEQVIGELNIEAAKNYISKITDLIQENNDYSDISALLEDYRKILDKIKFNQINNSVSEISRKMLEIGSIQSDIAKTRKNTSETKKNLKDNAEKIGNDIKSLENEIRKSKKEIKEFWTDDFLKFENAENIHKKLVNKFNSFISRLSSEYKTTIAEISSMATDKMKYENYVAYLEMLIDIQGKDNKIKKEQEELKNVEKATKAKVENNATKINGFNKSINDILAALVPNLVNSGENLELILTQLDFNKLSEYQNYIDSKELISDFSEFIEKIEDDDEVYSIDEITNIFKKRYLTIFLDATEFGGKYYNYARESHNQDIDIFRKYDAETLKINSARVRCELVSKLPNLSAFTNTHHGGEINTLRKELKKKSRLMSTRKLIENLPVLIPQIKPCMMMSPLTISSYFGTNTNWKFDVVIFDEASQVKPEYAVPALVRGKQIIIAGDSKQMPPTRFFDSSFYDDEDYDENEVDISDLESILDEMSTKLPDKYLNWHYRSKDESLIAFSNNHFYSNRLSTFPSVGEQNIGVEYVYCKDGVWENKNGNKKEAEAVALLIFDHIEKQPEKSLGVVAFGKSQESAIWDAVNKLRDLECNKDKEEFFSENNDEPFFVKNLENVQGDERDRIILSCGYGKDSNGTFAMRFGPLMLAGGERRLNVAISRAKYQMTVISSFKASEIRDTANNPNRKLIRDFIDYAERGQVALLGDDERVDDNYQPEFDSGFEAVVYDFLNTNGYNVRTQVGSSGYKIDMAILHPEIEGRFVLAIECDGAAYHSSRTARDRDILRQEILENLGWKFYRIWSTNWINDTDNEKNKLLNAVDDAIKDYANMNNDRHVDNSDTPIEVVSLPQNGSDNLDNVYVTFNKILKEKYGQGHYNSYGYLEQSWNSLDIMKTTNVIELVLEKVIKYKNGFSPEDVFREINLKLFEKNRYTEQAKQIYERIFEKNFIDKNIVEIVNDSIRLK